MTIERNHKLNNVISNYCLKNIEFSQVSMTVDSLVDLLRLATNTESLTFHQLKLSGPPIKAHASKLRSVSFVDSDDIIEILMNCLPPIIECNITSSSNNDLKFTSFAQQLKIQKLSLQLNDVKVDEVIFKMLHLKILFIRGIEQLSLRALLRNVCGLEELYMDAIINCSMFTHLKHLKVLSFCAEKVDLDSFRLISAFHSLKKLQLINKSNQASVFHREIAQFNVICDSHIKSLIELEVNLMNFYIPELLFQKLYRNNFGVTKLIIHTVSQSNVFCSVLKWMKNLRELGIYEKGDMNDQLFKSSDEIIVCLKVLKLTIQSKFHDEASENFLRSFPRLEKMLLNSPNHKIKPIHSTCTDLQKANYSNDNHQLEMLFYIRN